LSSLFFFGSKRNDKEVIRRDKIVQKNKKGIVGVRCFTPGLWKISNPSREGEKGDFKCERY